MATTPKQTTLDNDNTKPSVTKPGDGPADTTDPAERATTVGPGDLSDEAKRAGTVNAAVPLPIEAKAKAAGEQRVETYTATRPDGTEVTVEHNLDTGETSTK